MDGMSRFFTPQLELIHRGKVRDSFRVDRSTRLIVATDRLSAFDRELETLIPGKGAALTHMAAYWFAATREVFPHHMVRPIGERGMLVREADPIRVEFVVRGYLAGSAWRAYTTGARAISGVRLPEGLGRNARLPEPVITPTTKDAHDEEITPSEIVRRGILSQAETRRLEAASLALFQYASSALERQGIVLVDTKYEFGRIDGALVLIDEIHTPDSSRFWSREDYERDPAKAEALDKEYVRAWLMQEEGRGQRPATLPNDVVAETARRYRDICRRVTGGEPAGDGTGEELVRDLVREGILRDGCVVIVMGSARDIDHAKRIAEELGRYEIAVEFRVASAHKTPALVADLASELGDAREPLVVIAVAGLSNGLGGALAANLAAPVINCPPFRSEADLVLNLASSVMMPSQVPAMTVVRPENAAAAAVRCLQRPRLREVVEKDMESARREIAGADAGGVG
jgi:fusion protein PurCD